MAARGLAQGTLPFLLHNSMLYQCIFYVLVDCLNHLLPCNLIILWVRKSAVVKPIRIQKSSSNPVQYAYSSGKLHQGLWGSGIKCWNLTELHIHTSIIILKRSAACLPVCLHVCLTVCLCHCHLGWSLWNWISSFQRLMEENYLWIDIFTH